MNISISFALLMLSAWFDAKGFQYATQTWSSEGEFVLKQGALSLVCFVAGVSIYLYSVRFLTLVGVSSATVQTLLWFAATIAGVAIMSGEFQKWNIPQYAALVAVVSGLSTLMVLAEH